MKKWTKASYLRRKLRVSKQNLRECLKNLMSDRVNKAKKAKGAKRAVEIFTRIRSVNFRSNRNIMILGDKSIK